jgi:Skp family chaperone for outer membrane proteins
MKKSLPYLALALAIIALIVGAVVYSRVEGIRDVKARMEGVERDVDELAARVEAEAQAKQNELNTQAKLLEAKGQMLRARVELEINQNHEKAIEAMESAEEKLAKARTTADEALQARIDQLGADVDTLEQKARDESVEAINDLQILLDEWEVRLSGSAE